jgi:hypothetical protein
MEVTMSDVVNQTLGSLEARVNKLTEDVKALTELVAKMHVDFYMHINDIPKPTLSDPVDYDDSLIK